MSETVLRTYKIKPGAMEEWVRCWREIVVPYREAHGFEITGGWVNAETDEFVWMVKSRDPAKPLAQLNEEYKAAKQAEPMSPEGDHLVESVHYVIVRDVALVPA